MEKENIIILDDDSKYMLLDETKIEESKFFFAVRLNDNDTPSTQYEVFKEVTEDGELYIDILGDIYEFNQNTKNRNHRSGYGRYCKCRQFRSIGRRRCMRRYFQRGWFTRAASCL